MPAWARNRQPSGLLCRPVRRRHAALLAVAMTLLTACGTTRPPAVTSTQTLLSDALTRMQSATTYHLLMTYTQSFADFSVDLHVKLPGDAYGTVKVNGSYPVNVLQTGGKLYVEGQEFVSEYGGSYAGRLFGDRWIVYSPDVIRVVVLDLPRLTQIPTTILQSNLGIKRADHVSAGTEITAALTEAFGTVYIGENPPHSPGKFRGG